MIQHNVINRDNYDDKNIETIFKMLDSAIDDMENGRIVSEEQMWEELSDIEGE